MNKLEMKRIAKKAINEPCYCQVLHKNIVLLEASDNYILCRDKITDIEFRITLEMTGWEVDIVKFRHVAESN